MEKLLTTTTTKKEYFVLSDIHGYYNEMLNALAHAEFDLKNKNHIIILCGDMLDRGKQAKEVLDFFYNLYKEGRFIYVIGNHEKLFEEMIARGRAEYHDIHNGTDDTLAQLQIDGKDEFSKTFRDFVDGYDKRFDELRKAAVYYYETPHYIFVHGWIPTLQRWDEGVSSQLLLDSSASEFYDPNWRTAANWRWDEEALWANGMEKAAKGIIEPGKTIVCGHWHCSYGHVRRKYPEGKTRAELRDLEFSDREFFKPFYGDGVIGIDACTAYTGLVNCLHFTEDEI